MVEYGRLNKAEKTYMKKTLFCFMAAAALSVSAGDVNRKRDVIFYHYDIMPVLWPKALPYTPDALVNGFQHPSRLMDGLPSKALAAEVKPDTFVYVPMPNFANLSAMVPSNEPQMNQPSGSTWMAGCKNAMPEIKKAGKSQDPITVVGNWVRKNKKEFFVGLCVNDNLFQSGYSQLKPSPPGPILVENYLFNSFKIKHPDWLMSSHQDSAPLKGLTRSGNAPYASWCLVDYNQPEVRAKYTAIAKEIIAGYELDGLLLDFCRQPRLFRSVAWGGTASAAQCQMITEMIGLISAAAKEKADNIYQQWQDGDATEESFAALAEEYSEDTGSKSNGGLYERVSEGDMVTEFNDWALDAARQSGDTGIVETTYGYHIMYYVGDNELVKWQAQVYDKLKSDAYDEWAEALHADADIQKVDSGIKHVG